VRGDGEGGRGADDSVPIVSLTVLPLWVRLKAGPLPWDWLTKLLPEGRVSVRVTDWAALGPLLVTVTVQAMLAPGRAVAGPVLLTARSAGTWAVVLRLPLVTEEPDSCVLVVT